ncbi:hypothetical protein ACOMHN_005044 [Nucella lapillus]
MRQVQVRQEERQVQVRQVQVRHEERQVQVRQVQVQVQVRQEDLRVRRVQVPQVQVQQEERQGHVPQVQAAHYFGVSGYDLDCYPKEHLETLENIWNILEKAYGDQRPVQQLLTTFNSLTQYPGEGVRDFSNRVNKAFRDLTARQRAEGQRPLDEQILRDQFISGLQDGILMRQVRAKTMEGPGLSFIDVRSYVIKWELQETNMRKPAPHVEAAVASAEPQHALTDLTKMIKLYLPCRGQCTFLELDQSPHTHGVILSKAGWSWGSEMGANDQGVCGGCVSVWTRLCHPGDHEEKLLGCDLVRLALERSCTSREAVDTVTSLLVKHGQGGPCCEDPSYGQWTYHNSFLFSDRQQAWAVETAGTQWVAKRITEGVYVMSSMLSIGTDYDLSSAGLREAAAESGTHCKSDSGSLVDFQKAFDAVFEGLSLSKKQQPSHRLHCGQAVLQTKSKKARSVVHTPGSKLPDVHWLTATPDPDLSIFKPFIFCPTPHLGKATLSPTLTSEGRVRSGSQTCADRRHLLYRMHEQGREAMESGSSQGKRLLDTLRGLEKQCVKDVAEFMDSFEPALMEEVQELFKDITESEVKFYK